MTKTLRNVNGNYWNGSCWGVEQAAEEYKTPEGCPAIIDYGGFGCVREVDDGANGDTEVTYYCDNEPIASITFVSARD